jgi:hypothetical protein
MIVLVAPVRRSPANRVGFGEQAPIRWPTQWGARAGTAKLRCGSHPRSFRRLQCFATHQWPPAPQVLGGVAAACRCWGRFSGGTRWRLIEFHPERFQLVCDHACRCRQRALTNRSLHAFITKPASTIGGSLTAARSDQWRSRWQRLSPKLTQTSVSSRVAVPDRSAERPLMHARF